MNPDHAPVPPPAGPALNYLKLTLSLMAVVFFWDLINNWDAYKVGFIEGFTGVPHQASR